MVWAGGCAPTEWRAFSWTGAFRSCKPPTPRPGGSWIMGRWTSSPSIPGPWCTLAAGCTGWGTLCAPGQSLIQATVVGNPEMSDPDLEAQSREQLSRWFGPEVHDWRLLRLYRIVRALPDQKPPTPDPLAQPVQLSPRLFVCGEYQSLSSLHWAMVSGRRAGEAVVRELRK